MKISTRGRYALRLMMDIALAEGDAPVRIKDIAARQELSEKYLEQIVSVLNKAGQVRSSRGPQGGYRLTRAPEDYTAGEIVSSVEGGFAPVACLESEKNECPRHLSCATLRLWEKLNDAIRSVMESVTLADLIQWQRELEAPKKK
ncbi:MAG: Rrf2 family transcriptional regulator [Schwartzia sp.]|nr:Rrf2 family transcriptional regulator [Schwartzia sp. (in: firmicutes)]